MEIVVAEFMAPEGLRLLASAADVRYDPELGGDRPALLAAVRSASALIVRNRTAVDAELCAAAPGLRVVGRLGAGLDNLDLARLRAAGIAVASAPGVNASATAEFTLCLTFALLRGLRAEWLGVGGPDWCARAQYAGLELCGRTLGLIGLGRVGQLVARKARALGLTVLAAQPGRDPQDPTLREAGAELAPLREVLRRSDIVSLHAALTPATRRMFGRQELALCRPTAVVINTARGALLDEAALAVALREGWIAGAALDVRDPEPPPLPDPLDGVPHLIRTPHVAGLTREAQRQTGLQVAAEVLRQLGTRVPPLGAADAGAVQAAEAAEEGAMV